jgi:aspartyl protease family protein
MTFSNLGQSDWQNIVFSSIVVFMLLSSILSRKELSLAKILKYILIWSVIVIIGLACYSYRHKFFEFTSNLSSEINPSKAVVSNNQLIIRLADDGHFYLDTNINDHPVRFMVDTGSSDVVLNLSDAKRIGIDTNKLIFNKNYQTANGQAFGASLKIREVMVSGVKFKDVNVSVNSANMGVSLLGMSFLKRFTKYEVYQDKLILTL